MSNRGEVARAIAYFDTSDDVYELHRLTREIAPRVKKQVKSLIAKGSEESIPAPADLYPAKSPATRQDALRIVKQTSDIALLQALARSIGRRIEAVEIVASADFPEGCRVEVPEEVAFPPTADYVAGAVRESGTTLTVQLDNGERWVGPPSLARREGTA
ncbi:MAG: hypothetical protein U5Q44_03215 [Dehalococcoidia bacterium]|nr:hypothetical protein [Dehalococcoidia bacterium]